MRNLKIILGIVALVLVLSTGWQIGSAVVSDMNFQEDLRDLGSQAGAHVGVVVPPGSDEDAARAVIRKATEHGIELEPTQVTVRRMGSGETSTLYFAADYTVPINLVLFSFNLHFVPSSER
ncbi:MAG: hypothetical protein WA741_16775 [Candidatus Sulfotelmatobacter sp.]